jgi:preprotein translocase subunit SecF
MMARLGDLPGRLYRGEISVRIVQRQKMWYAISGLILLISIVALAVRGLNFSTEFTGGSVFQFPATSSSSATQGQIQQVVSGVPGVTGQVTVQHVAAGLQQQWSVQTGILNDTQSGAVQTALEHAFHFTQNQMIVNITGPSWGGSVTGKMIEALIIFFVVIVIYLSIAFEWKMAVSAFVALLHDILIATGIYALVGFQVSPDTVIGLLTILGYSLYDTVVVFDKVRENTAGLLTTAKSTYTEAANLALNQTLVRSINTSLTALLPVASILFIGGTLLGTGTLNDLSLVLFVGMLSGTYSSLCIATPVLADLKERETRYKELAVRVQRRLAGGRAGQRAQASGDAASAVSPATAPGRTVPSEEGADDVNDGADTASSEALTGGDEVTVSSAAGAAAAGSAGSRPRPQPRRNPSAQRRPGTRRKRR